MERAIKENLMGLNSWKNPLTMLYYANIMVRRDLQKLSRYILNINFQFRFVEITIFQHFDRR